MKKFLLPILALSLLVSCSDSGRKYRTSHKKLQRAESRFIYKIKPSDSMQVGIPKKPQVEVEELVFTPEASDHQAILNEEGKYSGVYKIGDPYEVFGVSYFPQNYEDYEETGMASWYGDDFHGRRTANGEIYNMEEMTAAHPTLPLPSLVRVTNLRNGKSVIVRVNDRGPFAKNRILDVSERAADELGFKGQGTTEVKIELLRDETEELLEKLKIKN